MKTRIFVSIAFMLAVMLPAGARSPVVVTEDAHEFTAAMFALPSTTSSSFSVSRCTACNRQTFTLSNETQFFVGKSEVRFADFKSALAEHPKADILIVTPIGKSTVLRIKTSLVDQK